MKKKILFLLLTIISILCSLFFIFNKFIFQNHKNTVFLKILNSEDYIDRTIIDDFEKENPNVKIIYDTFDTQENMFNIIKTNKIQYDLICVSDYMLQKIMNHDATFITKLNQELIPNYYQEENKTASHCSDFIKQILIKEKKYEKTVCYMWGFIGLVYNVEFPTFKKQKLKIEEIDKDMNDWNNLWDKKYQKTISIKDSIRDTYALGILKTFQNELSNANEEEKKNIFNYGNEKDEKAVEHIEKIKNNLKELKNNIFGFENDSGKEDIANNKIGINLSWSGDAVYSIKKARQKKINLHFSVPDNWTTNIWFDQWIMTKYAVTNGKEKIAHDFLNFISKTDNVIKNNKKIGYTSAIASEKIFQSFKKEYEDTNSSEKEIYDLNYFFKSNENDNYEYQIKVSKEKKYQLMAQFPKSENIKNLIIMDDFGKNNELILNMWNELKSDDNNFYIVEMIVILIETIIFICFFLHIKKIKHLKKLFN